MSDQVPNGSPADVDAIRAVVTGWRRDLNGAAAVRQADVAAIVAGDVVEALDEIERLRALVDMTCVDGLTLCGCGDVFDTGIDECPTCRFVYGSEESDRG